MNKDLVVVLTALNLEYEAVRRRLKDPQVHRHARGTRFEVGEIPGKSCRVALGITSKGNHPAAVLAERAIQQFAPAAVLFVGIAGALWETTKLGDVVMATHVYAYHGGTSEDDGLKARPRGWEAPHAISQLGYHLQRTNDWIDGTREDEPPQVHFGAIAAGEIVQNSRISTEAHWIRQHYNDALAIEMEAAGVAQAGHLNTSPVAIVRGISDLANGTKNSHADRSWQPRAADNAAAFAIRLATEIAAEGVSPMPDDISSATPRSITNTATSSTVGIMAGGSVVGSTVNLSARSTASGLPDLIAELNDLRNQLHREHAAGALDDDTFHDAQAQLDTASQAVRENTSESKTKVTIALKRLRGLIADVANLATQVAPLITAVGALP